MPLVIKDILAIQTQITDELETQNSPASDFNQGSLLYTLRRAVASAISEGWIGLLDLYSGFFMSTASTQDQDLRAGEISMVRNQGSFALGSLVVFTSTPVTINQGQLFSQTNNTSLIYLTTASVTVNPPFGYIPVQALSVGYKYNALANTSFTALNGAYSNQTFIVGNNYTTTATGNIQGGTNLESQSEFATRYADYITNLQQGTTKALTAVLGQTSGVGRFIIERAKPIPGWITITLLDYTSSIPSTVAANIQTAMDASSAAGMAYILQPARPRLVDVSIKAYCTSQTVAPVTVSSEVTTRVGNYFTGLQIGEPVYLSNLISSVDGIANVSHVELISPTQSITVSSSELATLGNLSVQVVYV